ncbi:MAG: hypothetical protein NC124_02235 [Clostridium sp.]|nr:hypothetical protein [Clostridium sp.]
MHKFKKLMREAVDKHLPDSKMEEISEVIAEHIESLDKEERHEMYFDLDIIINGDEISKEKAEHTVSEFEDYRGQRGGYWTYEQVASYLRSKGHDESKGDYSVACMYIVMNMQYSDYVRSIEKLTTDAAKIAEVCYCMACDFLDDVDAKDHKLKRYLYFVAD